jgi:hypothetical protein
MVRETNIIKKLKHFEKEIRKEINLDKFILFGSYARGNQREDSDLDVILVSPSFISIPFYDRSYGLRKKFGKSLPMDIICLTPEEFNKLKKKITIVREAVENGIEI